jgi:diacylglycerol kinase family enzyme
LPRVEHLKNLLLDARLEVKVLTDLDEIAATANRWYAEGSLRALVGVGGDGTAAELVNRTEPGVPITLLAAGTENLLARHLNLGTTPEACCQTLLHGGIVRLDAARAGKRVFLLMAGCGFDAEVVRRLHGQRKGHIHTSSYLMPILDTARHYEYPELRIYWGDERPDGAEHSLTLSAARWLFAFNLPCYGGGLRIAPEADGADGLLDVCTFRRGGLWRGLKFAAAVLLARQKRLTDFAVRRIRRLRIVSDVEVPYQLDGDPGGLLPVEIESLPERLTLVVPHEGIAC